MKHPIDQHYEYTEDGKTKAILTYRGMAFEGVAKTHPEDTFYPAVGADLATCRAMVKLLKFTLNFEIRQQIKSLEHLMATFETSTQYDPKSYEATRTRSYYWHLKEEETECLSAIEGIKLYIDSFRTK